MKIYYYSDLDQLGCADPGCADPGCHHPVLYLNQLCHPDSATFARYEKVTHHLVIECARCRAEIIRIFVGPDAEKLKRLGHELKRLETLLAKQQERMCDLLDNE
jgi:hypothetical protein